jgi:hypothetical protein
MNDQDRAEKDARRRLIDEAREALRWRNNYENLARHRGLRVIPGPSLPDFVAEDDAVDWAKVQGDDVALLDAQALAYVGHAKAYRSAYFGILNGA